MSDDAKANQGEDCSPVQSRGTVLIVDENRADLHCYRFILRMIGYQVLTCGTYEEGIQLLNSGGFDLVILSQGTPEFEGRGVLQCALQIDRQFPVLVVARNLNMPCYLEAMQLGAADYLAEPITAQELAGAVQTHLWMRPTIRGPAPIEGRTERSNLVKFGKRQGPLSPGGNSV